MNSPRILTLADLRSRPRQGTAVWATPSVRARVEAALPFALTEPPQVPPGTRCLIAIGGGTLIDEAKAWRLSQAGQIELIAIPSIWGSGAEVSPIAVLNRDGKKEIRIDPKLLPDARAVWPELAEGIPAARVRQACGDAWAHALEGFLSPLADDALRAELAGLIGQMAVMPLANDPAWFELGARACAGQARSGVGLVHGIAHVLEPVLRQRQPGAGWGHAKLCSIYLWPVMRFNEQASDNFRNLAAKHNLDTGRILAIARKLFEERPYEAALPVLKELWPAVLRDRCTRTNSALVRPAALDYFTGRKF